MLTPDEERAELVKTLRTVGAAMADTMQSMAKLIGIADGLLKGLEARCPTPPKGHA